MAGRLEDKVAIITGASRGLGEYCALGFAKEGARVAVAARTTEQQDPRLPGTIYSTCKQIEDAGCEALPVICNVADEASIHKMVGQVLDHWGRIDILMNNAAIQPPGDNSTISPKHWELSFKVNVHGPFHCIRAVLPAMIKQGSGNIINISSIGSTHGTPYGGTKRALEAMTEGLGAELEEQNIVVNSLKPMNAIETPGFLFAQVPRNEEGSEIPELPSRDSYVEAAILLATQSVTFSGRVVDDAEAIGLLADDGDKNRFRKINPDYWTAIMENVQS